MLDRLQDSPPDALLALIAQFAADERDDKIDLGVGVYRTDDGATPVFEAIKGAERRLLDEQDSKAYLGPEGDKGFVQALIPVLFGPAGDMGGLIDGLQTPGGTGAVRLAVALAQRAGRCGRGAAGQRTRSAGPAAPYRSKLHRGRQIPEGG